MDQPISHDRLNLIAVSSGATASSRGVGVFEAEVAAAWLALTYRHLQQDALTLRWSGTEETAPTFGFHLDPRMAGAALVEQVLQRLNPIGPVTRGSSGQPDLYLCCLALDKQPEEADLQRRLPKDADIQLLILNIPQGRQVWLQYSSAPETATKAIQLASQLERLWAAMQAEPTCALADLALLDASDAEALYALGHGPDLSLDMTPLYRLVEAQSALNAEATAVSFQGQRLSYGALNARANQLARLLRDKGVTAGSPVASFMEPCLEVAISLLAIHKAGGIYVPLDPTHPAERIAVLLGDIQPVVVVTQSYLCDKVPTQGGILLCMDLIAQQADKLAQDNLNLDCNPSQMAYIVYTSGTTGKPKGVMASHANLSHYVQVALAAYRMGPGDRMPAMARFTFSITMFELWTPLVSGAELILIPRADVLDFNRLIALLEGITFIHCAPALMRNLLNHMDAKGVDRNRFLQLRHASCGGDFVAFELLERMKRAFPAAEIFVIYGCTEVACMGCTFQAPRDLKLTCNTVGRMMANVKLRLLDSRLRPVPMGVKGEVCFGGPGINQGYWRLPALTAERFIELGGERFYRTGDWGRFDASGQLELLGRTDFQIKVRGMRMEPLEIESVLRQIPAVRDALVAAKLLEGATENTLVAYLTFVVGATPELEAIRDFMKNRLPGYMVPSLFMVLDAMPVNLNGKLDRSALPAPHARLLLGRPGDGELPQTPTELALADIWADVLSMGPIRRDSDFFALGGDSLSCVQMMMQVEQRLGRELPLDAPVQGPTLREMAALIDSGTAHGKKGIVLLRTGGHKPPLFCVYGALLYRELSQCLAPGRPVYAAFLDDEVAWLSSQPQDMGPVLSIPEMAGRYLKLLRSVQPHGPYSVAGESFGGLIALEMAQQLVACGESVSTVIMFDTQAPNSHWQVSLPLMARLRMHSQLLRERGMVYVREKFERRCMRAWESFAAKLQPLFQYFKASVPRKILEAAGQRCQRDATHQASRDYLPQPYAGEVLLFRATERNYFEFDADQDLGWGPVLHRLRVEQVPGNHLSILRTPHVQTLASLLDLHLEKATDPTNKGRNSGPCFG